MRTARTMGTMLLAATVLLALTAATADAGVQKGKPPKNPTATPTPGGGCPDNGGGTIYYTDASDVIHALDADCGTDASYPSVPGNALRPSKVRHNGKRWFLSDVVVQGLPTYPDGRRARELWAHDEDGVDVQLTDYTLGGTELGAVWITQGGLQWAPDDSFISWVAARWVDDDDDGIFDRQEAGGIYRAQVTYDASGNVSGLADPRPATPVVLVDTTPSGLPVYRHAWSPNASQLFYSQEQWNVPRRQHPERRSEHPRLRHGRQCAGLVGDGQGRLPQLVARSTPSTPTVRAVPNWCRTGRR